MRIKQAYNSILYITHIHKELHIADIYRMITIQESVYQMFIKLHYYFTS